MKKKEKGITRLIFFPSCSTIYNSRAFVKSEHCKREFAGPQNFSLLIQSCEGFFLRNVVEGNTAKQIIRKNKMDLYCDPLLELENNDTGNQNKIEIYIHLLLP